MMTATDAVRLFQSQLGTVEDPLGSNNIIYNTEYYGHPVSGAKYPYCAVTIWWIMKHLGDSSLYYGGKKTASCITLLSWARSAKLTVPVDQLRPGDIVFYDWNANGQPDHVGMVEQDTGGTEVVSLEGNTDDGVFRKRRNRRYIMAAYRPLYQGEDGAYNTINQVPVWYREAVQAYVDAGAISGTGSGLNLTDNDCRQITFNWRYINHADSK